MLQVLIWWLVLQVIGLLALPITLRLLRFLPDHGFGFSRQVGLILSAFAFWLLVTLGILQNTTSCIVFVLLLMGGFSAYLWSKDGEWMLAALGERKRVLLITECVFIVGLAGFALFRAYNPDIAGTEKPMEFAFINGILRSRTFPPNDPWLSGYAISYYYFGYVMTAMLTKLSGVPSEIAFNFMGSTLFALTLSGSFSLVYNMAQAHLDRQDGGVTKNTSSVSGTAVGAGFLGVVLVALMGNLEGVFELLRAHGAGSEALWQWLDIKNLHATAQSATWYPDDTWWWWRASRVIHDVDAAGRSMEVIDEFPFFSFLLGDNHPHVLALPFVLLALALALNLVLNGSRQGKARSDAEEERGLWERVVAFFLNLWPGDTLEFVLYSMIVGGLGFLNTWDYPIYLGILVLVYAMRHQAEVEFGQQWLLDVLAVFGALLFTGILSYLPFYISFRSQAGGIGWVGAIKTRLHQYLIMMGVFVSIQIGFLLSLVTHRRRKGVVEGPPSLAKWVAGLMALFVLFCLFQRWWTGAFIWAIVAPAAALWLWGSRDGWGEPLSPTMSFALLLVAVGFALTGSVEFIFLRDTFGTRMNTIFKFYYQAWVLLAVSSAYGLFHVLHRWERLRSMLGRVATGAWLAVSGVLVLAGLSYTVAAISSKAGGFRGQPTLDGTRYVRQYREADYEAIQWLKANAPAGSVLLEAPGGSYSEYNWVSAHTGIPTVLGWGGHELQWRGNYDEAGRREPDIAAIYQSLDKAQKRQLLEKYDVDFVYVGPLEREKYGLNLAMIGAFDGFMQRCYEGKGVIIYCWSP
ncbi:MAG: DUF2298 domain-containing protein [Chloroflexota bacterium]|nr:DUF2298 domain-containing protein [Chloroflexota bacterium]